MKGFIALLLVVLIAITGYNWWQVQELRQEIAGLQNKIQEQQGGGVTDQVVAQATRALAEARDALAHTNMDTARSALDNAKRYLEQAGRTASEKTAPTVKWLREETADLTKQAQERLQARR